VNMKVKTSLSEVLGNFKEVQAQPGRQRAGLAAPGEMSGIGNLPAGATFASQCGREQRPRFQAASTPLSEKRRRHPESLVGNIIVTLLAMSQTNNFHIYHDLELFSEARAGRQFRSVRPAFNAVRSSSGQARRGGAARS
jgi:hypothetical protein